ncbi:NAD(P)-dependent oxidoreductase [Bacillaceae bacterium IKA-2]|nr:NAD(P)-dependent oxidoreductase [Bacillaceae bacterium IKA-2]
MKKIVVTGALGFIGFSLTQRLLEKGFEVVGIDGMIVENLQELYEEKLLWIGRNALFQFINQKIEEIDLSVLFEDVDTIYHLAALTKRDENEGALRIIDEDNLRVTKKIISACDKRNKLIYTSSTQVYDERGGSITERTPLNPKTGISLSYLALETLIKSRCSERLVPYVIFRLPTIYGPWQREEMAYSQLIINHFKSSKDSVECDSVTEDVLYIDDILDTLIEAGLKKDCQNEEYNLSTGKKNQWHHGKSIINNEPFIHPKNERLQLVLSNQKAKNDLGFEVLTDLKTGIEAQKNHINKYQQFYVK